MKLKILFSLMLFFLAMTSISTGLVSQGGDYQFEEHKWLDDNAINEIYLETSDLNQEDLQVRYALDIPEGYDKVILTNILLFEGYAEETSLVDSYLEVPIEHENLQSPAVYEESFKQRLLESTNNEPGEYLLRFDATATNDQDQISGWAYLYLNITGDEELADINADFDINPNPAEVGQTVVFTDASESTSEIINYNWEIDGEVVSTNEQFTEIFDEEGQYTISLEVENEEGDTDTETKTLVVVQDSSEIILEADFNMNPNPANTGQTVIFTDASESSSQITEYLWTIDGEQQSNNAQFNRQFQTPGEYQVRLVVINEDGLLDSEQKTLTINQAPEPLNAEFEITKDNFELGILTLDASESTGNIENYLWRESGDLFATNNVFPAFYVTEYRIHEFELTVTDGQGNQDTQTKLYVPTEDDLRPIVDFEYDPLNPEIFEEIQFNGEIVFNTSPIETYVWRVDGQTFDSGITAQEVFEEAGTYQIEFSVIDSNARSATAQKEIVVSEPANVVTPQARFEIQADEFSIGSLNLDASTSIPGTFPIETYEWSIDGEDSNIQGQFATIQITEPREYSIKLTVTDTQGNQDSITKLWGPEQGQYNPEIDFEFMPQNPETGEEVEFVGEVEQAYPNQNIIDYTWEIDSTTVFGDELFATYIFSNEGTYDVTFSVEDSFGWSNSITKQITVSEAPLPELEIVEVGANANVVQNELQHFFVIVESQGEPINNAQIEYFYADNDELVGICETDSQGLCVVNPEIKRDPGQYEVIAKATKEGYIQDEASLSFRVWEKRYLVQNLELYEDETQMNETYEFYRGDTIYSSFRVYDQILGQYINSENVDLVDVFLRINDAPKLDFTAYEVPGGSPSRQPSFDYVSDQIPLDNEYLGQGLVFAMVFNFTDDTAGQSQIQITIRNNELEFNPPDVIFIPAGDFRSLDFKDFVNDFETPSEDITITWENETPFTIQNTGNNVLELGAPFEQINRAVQFTASDNEGSEVTRTIELQSILPQGPESLFRFSPQDPEVFQTVTFESTSNQGEAEIEEYLWQINGQNYTQGETFEIQFQAAGRYEINHTVTDANGLSDSSIQVINVGELTRPEAILEIPGVEYQGGEITLDASKSFARIGSIVEYRYVAIRAKETKLDEKTVRNNVPLTLKEQGTYSVTLTVVDSQGLTHTTTETVVVSRKQPGVVQGEHYGLFVNSIDVTGVDFMDIAPGEEFVVRATVSNDRDEHIENLRMSFTLPELAFDVKSQAFDLAPGESRTVKIESAYLPYWASDFAGEDQLASVGVRGSGFTRNIAIPVRIVTN